MGCKHDYKIGYWDKEDFGRVICFVCKKCGKKKEIK